MILQESETVDYMWASDDEIRIMKSTELLSESMRQYISNNPGKIKMVFPTLAYKEKAIDYINELTEYGSEINGTGALDRFLRESTYEKWLEKIMNMIDIASSGVIQKCEGTLKDEFFSNTYGKMLQMYVISK